MTRIVPLAAFACFVLAGPSFAQDNSEIRYMKGIFAQIQPLSFRDNVEYCGYVGFDANDNYVASRIIRGKTDECAPEWPENFEPFASFHTHAGFDREAYSEVPSVTDMESDEDEGVDGWVATPGGRLWFIDTNDMIASQICGIGCLDKDPKFVRGAQGPIEVSYTYRELQRYEQE